MLPGPPRERILHRGIAEAFSPVLLAVGVGDGGHAFHVRFAAPLGAAERDVLFVRPAGADWRAELAPELRTTLADSAFPVPPVAANGPDAPRAGGPGKAISTSAPPITSPAGSATWRIPPIGSRTRWCCPGLAANAC